jgi:hypothetical protein
MINQREYESLLEEMEEFDDLKEIIFHELMTQGILINNIRLLPTERYPWAITRMREIIQKRNGK